MKKLIVAGGMIAASVLLLPFLMAQDAFVTLDKVIVNGNSIDMSVSGPVKYHAFKITNPPRVVVEFSNTEHNVREKEIAVNGSLVKRIRSGQFQNDPVKLVRVVIDLAQNAEYQLQGNGRVVTLVLNPGDPITGEEAASQNLKDIEKKALDLKARPGGTPKRSTMVKTMSIVPVPAPSLTPAVVPAPATAPAESKADAKQVQPAPAATAAAPARTEPAQPATATEKAAAEKKAPVNQEFSDEEIVAKEIEKETPKVEVKIPAPAKPAQPEALPAQKQQVQPRTAATKALPAIIPSSNSVSLPRKPITVDFEDADIRDVLRILSMKSGINIIYGSDVDGTVTMRLENVPFDKAFETILSLKGLVKQDQGGNILRVATPEKIATERAQAITFTKVFPLNYAKADEVKANLDAIRNAEGRRGNISVDERTNSLIITDTPEGLTSLERIITDLDRKPAQVIIEAKIVEVVLNNKIDLGIEWQYANTISRDSSGNMVAIGGTRADTSSSAMGTDAASGATIVSPLAPAAGGTGVALPATAVSGQIGAFSFGIVSNQMRLTGMLTALAQKGLSKILSTPKVTTINNKEAKILVGQKIPYTTTMVSNSGSTQSTNFLDVGVKLTVVPTINVDQKITLQVHPEVSLFIRADAAGPVVGTREAITTVLVNNGETVVIGGLITEDEKKSATQVPLLGDLPIIGQLFKHNLSTKERTELLVFLTPQIVN